jgi:alpha-mannosidase
MAELVTVDESVWRFAQGFDTARKLLGTLAEGDARAHELDRGLRALMARIPVRGTPAAMHAACTSLFPELAALLMGRGAVTPVVCDAVGHAHIDTAWLWPIAETKRKCTRTFANVLRLQERFPHFHFLCSQAQQYAWVEERSPELFAEIAERVAEGRWEAAGAMWIEPDATCPSGESFIRQILHGCAYWESRFGAAAPQRFLYLPDTFGFLREGLPISLTTKPMADMNTATPRNSTNIFFNDAPVGVRPYATTLLYMRVRNGNRGDSLADSVGMKTT